MDPQDRIYVAGHNGLVGSALIRRLRESGFHNLITCSHGELDLCNRDQVLRFFEDRKPDYVFLAAAKVGGIFANSCFPADFIRENLAIEDSVIRASFATQVKRMLFLGASCIYPRDCPQPIREEYLLSGPLEPTNRPYALAKIAGIEMCWSYNRQYRTRYLVAMPPNIFGPGDSFDLQNSHVLSALMKKADIAKRLGKRELVVWGSGNPRREFLYSDDLADACVFLMNATDKIFDSLLSDSRPPMINVGSGSDITIRDLAQLVCNAVGFEGELHFDQTKPDGTMRKLMDSSIIHGLGWHHTTSLTRGIEKFYKTMPEG